MNLSDAATKLKEVVKKAAATSTDAKAIFEVMTVLLIHLGVGGRGKEGSIHAFSVALL